MQFGCNGKSILDVSNYFSFRSKYYSEARSTDQRQDKNKSRYENVG